MRMVLSALCFSLLLGVASSAAPPADEKAIVGTWVVESVKGDGEEVASLKGVRLTLKSGKAEFVEAGGEKVVGTYKLDPAAKPKAIDLALTLGSLTITHKGLYGLDNDALTICLPRGLGAARPGKLEVSGCDLWRLKRSK